MRSHQKAVEISNFKELQKETEGKLLVDFFKFVASKKKQIEEIKDYRSDRVGAIHQALCQVLNVVDSSYCDYGKAKKALATLTELLLEANLKEIEMDGKQANFLPYLREIKEKLDRTIFLNSTLFGKNSEIRGDASEMFPLSVIEITRGFLERRAKSDAELGQCVDQFNSALLKHKADLEKEIKRIDLDIVSLKEIQNYAAAIKEANGFIETLEKKKLPKNKLVTKEAECPGWDANYHYNCDKAGQAHKHYREVREMRSPSEAKIKYLSEQIEQHQQNIKTQQACLDECTKQLSQVTKDNFDLEKIEAEIKKLSAERTRMVGQVKEINQIACDQFSTLTTLAYASEENLKSFLTFEGALKENFEAMQASIKKAVDNIYPEKKLEKKAEEIVAEFESIQCASEISEKVPKSLIPDPRDLEFQDVENTGYSVPVEKQRSPSTKTVAGSVMATWARVFGANKGVDSRDPLEQRSIFGHK